MSAPRLEIDLDKIHYNAQLLATRLSARGISVTGVTKATLGSPAIAQALLKTGLHSLGDSRIENIETMNAAGIDFPMMLIRTPMISQVDRVVSHVPISFNTEIKTIKKLSVAAKAIGKRHGVVLMVELGDLREGIMLDEVANIVREILRLPNIDFRGIGTNLACRSGVAPGVRNMEVLSNLVDTIESTFSLKVEIVSGGNSANLNWTLGETGIGKANVGRVNNLRLGESILLGREPLYRQPIEGLHTDAIRLVGEVIESKVKPSLPWGDIAESAFGKIDLPKDRGPISQAILAIGRQDTDPCGLQPPAGIEILGASSDHLIVRSSRDDIVVGSEIVFQPNYSFLVRAMTSPYVAKVLKPLSSCQPIG